jgi:hypothetical protein
MSTSDADAARLAQLLNSDSDSDSAGEGNTDADQLRTTELLNRPSDAAEDDDEDELDHKPPEPPAPEPPAPEPPTAPEPASTPAAAPAPPATQQPRRASSRVLDRINSKLAELKGDAPPVDDETTARRFCERTAKAFDEDRTPELAIECVWENQSREDNSLNNLALAARATLTRNAIERRPPGPWGRAEAPRAGIIRRLQPLRRRPFEGRLASLLAESGPPQVEGLPDLSWRWLSPWQVDGRVHGTDRGVSDIEEVGAPDAWLYAPKWPGDDMTGYSYDENEARVRCRRWVRPRERQTCGELVRLLLAERPATRVASLLREAKSPEVDLSMLAASLVEVPVIKAPRPPPVEEKHARGVTVDYVWENQRWMRGWAPCVGLRKAPFDGASRPQLAALFKRHGGPPPLEAELAPEESGLPLDDNQGRASTWRWLGPWVLDSTSFGAERVSSDGSGEGGWIYGGVDWSRDGLGYSSTMTKRTFVRCRRWVRPREPADVAGPGPSVEENVVPAGDKLNFFS